MAFHDIKSYLGFSIAYWNVWRVEVNTDTGGIRILEQVSWSQGIKPEDG